MKNAIKNTAPVEELEVTNTAKNYVRAFKEVNPTLIDLYFSKQFTKMGYFYDYENEKWMDKATHNFTEVREWCATYNLEGIMPESEPYVELLDFQDKIAVVKIELAWAPAKWGCDYVFLSKEDDKWIIDNILWQSVI